MLAVLVFAPSAVDTARAANFAPDTIAGYTIDSTITESNSISVYILATNVYAASTFTNSGSLSNYSISGTYAYSRTGTNTGTIAELITYPPAAAGAKFTNYVTFGSITNGSFTNYSPNGLGGYSIYTGTFQVYFVPKPVFARFVLSGTNLVVTGSGGMPNTQYRLLSATNVASSMPSWTPVLTNNFDGSGGFSNSIAINPSAGPWFCRLATP